ncbi:MAG: amidohydrolase [Devosia sp.]|nr:amidohydrolase [Devosia sp.]
MRGADKAAPDLLLTGGIVLHPDGDLDNPQVESILVRDGRIAALGFEADQQAQAGGIASVDLTGKLVTPGFVNAHYHSHDVLLRGSFEGLPLDVWSLYAAPQQYARRSSREVYLRTLVGALECLTSGITTVQDMVAVVNADREHCDAIVNAYADSGIRVAVGIQAADLSPVEAAYGWRSHLPEADVQRLDIAPDIARTRQLIEELLAGDTGPRLDWVLAPSAPQRCSEDMLGWVADLSRRYDAQVFTHVYEAKIQALLAREKYGRDEGSYIRHLDRVGLLGPRLTIAHGVWITASEVAAMGAAGANVALNPTSNLKLRNGVAPIRSYLDSGVGVAIGCDNCSGNDAQNIFESMKLFALFSGLQSAAGVTGAAKAAFRSATLGGARALGRGQSSGALRPGFSADMVVLDLNDPAFVPRNSIVNQLVYGATPRSVDQVFVAGEMVVSGGRPAQSGLSGLLSEVEAAAALLRRDLSEVAARNGSLAECCLRIHKQGETSPFELDRFHLLG